MHKPNGAHNDLLVGLVSHVLARPILFALAERPLRHTELHAAVVAAGNTHVHSKTLDSALRYLCAHELVSRSDIPPRSTLYTITPFGRDVFGILCAIQRTFDRHLSSTTSGPEPPRNQ